MNDSINQLRGLLHIHARGAGHTVAAVKIATEINGLLVVADANQKRCEPVASAIHQRKLKALNLAEIAWPRAASLNLPIVVDHFALLQILVGIDNAVRDLESKLFAATFAQAKAETDREHFHTLLWAAAKDQKGGLKIKTRTLQRKKRTNHVSQTTNPNNNLITIIAQ